MDKNISDNEIEEIIIELRVAKREIGGYYKMWYKAKDRPTFEIDIEGGLNEEILGIFERHSLRLTSSNYAGDFMNRYRFVRPEWLTKDIKEGEGGSTFS